MVVKKAKLSKKEKSTAKEISEIVAKGKKSSAKKSKEISISTKELKALWKEDYPAVLTTKDLTKLVEEVTDYSLGEDLTAGSKNLRRYLRSLPQYQDDEMTYYRWSRTEEEDFDEVMEILKYYAKKAKVS
jgi:DNA-binding Xre family transcriptional regulator